MSLILFGLLIGLIAAAIAVYICQMTIMAVERRYARQLERLQFELSPALPTAEHPSLEVQALGRLTEVAVLGDYCAYCGCENADLRISPYAPQNHRQHPPCPVPFSRKLFIDGVEKCKPHSPVQSSPEFRGSRWQLPPAQQRRSH